MAKFPIMARKGMCELKGLCCKERVGLLVNREASLCLLQLILPSLTSTLKVGLARGLCLGSANCSGPNTEQCYDMIRNIRAGGCLEACTRDMCNCTAVALESSQGSSRYVTKKL